MTTQSNHETDHATQPPAKKSRKGAPAKNRNALRYGLRSSHLPPGCDWLTSQCSELRNSLEDAVLAAKGSISITDASAIDLASQSQRTLLLLQRRFRLRGAKMSDADTIAALDRTKVAAQDRHNAILSLGLSSMPTSPSRRRKGAAAAPSLAASMYAETSSTEGLASQTQQKASPVSADASPSPHSSDPIETRENFKQPPSLQDEG
jgi:hypothetical protein